MFYGGCIIFAHATFVHVYIYPYPRGLLNSTGTWAIVCLPNASEEILNDVGSIDRNLSPTKRAGTVRIFHEMYFIVAWIFAWTHDGEYQLHVPPTQEIISVKSFHALFISCEQNSSIL